MLILETVLAYIILGFLADVGVHFGDMFLEDWGSISDNLLDDFQEPFGLHLGVAAFPGSLGPVFEGLQAILAQLYNSFGSFSNLKLFAMGGLLGHLWMPSWLICG